MASRQQIKRRIGSVKNTKQITRAMQMVAASKLRRAQEAVTKPREYARLAREILTRLRHLAADDIALAGAYNGNIIRQMIRELQADRTRGVKTAVICIGRQIAHAASRLAGVAIEAVYQEMPDHPTADDLRPVLNSAVALFVDKKVDAIDIIFTHFSSTIKQEVVVQKFLPAGFDETELSDDLANAEVEPSPEELLRSATLRLLEAQIYQAILDAFASEHSMRMLAMKNATDNASDIIDDLTLEYNNARQAAITQELAEITGGAEALK